MQIKKIIVFVRLFSVILLLSTDLCYASSQALDAGKLYYDQLVQEQVESGNHIKQRSFPGRMYYDNLIMHEQKTPWVMQFVSYTSVATKGFDQNSQRKPLACALFGGEVRLQDIYLLARLSYENKLRVDNISPKVPERPAGSIDNFGTYESDQYLSSLANTALDINAESREFGVNVQTAYRFNLGSQKQVHGLVGLIVPIKTRLHVFNLNVSGGSFPNQTFAAVSGSGGVRLTPALQFSNEFSGLLDFFERGVLEPKGIAFEGRQRSMGFGDMTVFWLFDFADYFKKVSSLQIGMNIITPTGRIGSQNILFPISLGNGSIQFDFFANVIFTTRARMFNPAFHIVGNIAAQSAIQQRIAQRIVNPARGQINKIPLTSVLNPSPSFMGYYVDAFDEFDSLVPAFANNAFPVIVHRANRVLFGFGNYAYDILSSGLQLALFYDIMHKAGDRFDLDAKACKQSGNQVTVGYLDLESVSILSAERSHTLSWSLGYQFRNLVELNVGSQHVIAGKNVPRTHEIYASVTAVF